MKKLNDFIHECQVQKPNYLKNGFTFHSERWNSYTTYENANDLDFMDYEVLSMYRVKRYVVSYPSHSEPQLLIYTD